MNEQKIAYFMDDDPDFLELIPDVIRHPRFEVQTHCVINGYHTIDEILKVKPHVLFIDFDLPKANGGQILPILKSIETLRNLPIYFVTAYQEEQILPFLREFAFSGIVVKNESLRAKVLEILNELDRAVSAS